MVEISANPFIAEQLLTPHTMQLETLRFAVRRRHLRNDNSYIFLKLLFFFAATSDRVTYITDSKESGDEFNNVGFCLTYTQKKC